jgi:hypothetical protein
LHKLIVKNMTKKILITLICNLSFLIIFAQIPYPTSEYLDANNVKALVNSKSIQFFDGNTGRFEFPKGSGKKTMLISSFWIAGKDNQQQLHLSADLYNQNSSDFWTGPLTINGSAFTNQNVANQWNKLFKVSKTDIQNIIQNPYNPAYFTPSIRYWPYKGDLSLGQSWELAPFIDIDGDFEYSWEYGDYPAIYGDQSIFYILNDSKTHSNTLGQPLGIEIHVFAYSFDAPNDQALNNTIFYKFKVIKRSAGTLTDCYMGIFSDLDIGNVIDDYIGCDVKRSMYYAYNANASDALYGTNPPAQGVIFLGGPKMVADGLDNPQNDISGNQYCNESINGLNYGNGIVDDERLGMKYFMSFNASNNNMGKPLSASDYYSYLTGKWKDGQQLKWGGNGNGNGNNATNVVTNFMFPANSDSLNWGSNCGNNPLSNIQWNEQTTLSLPGDRRGVGSVGPFILQYDSVQYFDIAYTTAVGNGIQSSVEVLQQYADHLKNIFQNNTNNLFSYNHFLYQGIDESTTNQINVFPNPASDILNINNVKQNTKLLITDINGKVIYTKQINTGDNKIEISQFPTGIYLVRMITKQNISIRKIIKI